MNLNPLSAEELDELANDSVSASTRNSNSWAKARSAEWATAHNQVAPSDNIPIMFDIIASCDLLVSCLIT